MATICNITDLLTPEPVDFDRRFLLSTVTPSKYRVLRTLIGSVSIEHCFIGTQFTQNIDYLSKVYEFKPDVSIQKRLVNYISEDLTLEDARRFFFDIPYSIRNKDFFQRFENEVVNYLYYQNKQSFTTAYVYIYRILELISFSFPLIYASKTYDFKHTFNALKEFYENNKGANNGELGFLKSAVYAMFKDHDFLTTSVDIELDFEDEETQSIIYNAIYNVTKPDFYHTDTIDNRRLAIKFGEVSSFIASLRNRFFHLFNRGDKNLESSDLIDSDMFFSKINDPLFGWLSVLYLEVIRFSIGEVSP